MKIYPLALLAASCLSACTPPMPATQADAGQAREQWQESTLSRETIAKANAAVKDYQQCLNTETQTHINDKLDSRDIANGVLKICEDRLSGIKTAFDAEGVPDVISQRYMRKNRSQGAQSVLRYVMSVQALRAGEAEERAAAKNNNKP